MLRISFFAAKTPALTVARAQQRQAEIDDRFDEVLAADMLLADDIDDAIDSRREAIGDLLGEIRDLRRVQVV